MSNSYQNSDNLGPASSVTEKESERKFLFYAIIVSTLCMVGIMAVAASPSSKMVRVQLSRISIPTFSSDFYQFYQ